MKNHLLFSIFVLSVSSLCGVAAQADPQCHLREQASGVQGFCELRDLNYDLRRIASDDPATQPNLSEEPPNLPEAMYNYVSQLGSFEETYSIPGHTRDHEECKLELRHGTSQRGSHTVSAFLSRVVKAKRASAKTSKLKNFMEASTYPQMMSFEFAFKKDAREQISVESSRVLQTVPGEPDREMTIERADFSGGKNSFGFSQKFATPPEKYDQSMLRDPKNLGSDIRLELEINPHTKTPSSARGIDLHTNQTLINCQFSR